MFTSENPHTNQAWMLQDSDSENFSLVPPCNNKTSTINVLEPGDDFRIKKGDRLVVIPGTDFLRHD